MSAAYESGCSRLAESLSTTAGSVLEKHDETLLDDLAFTLNTRRSNLAWKSFAVCKDTYCLETLGEMISKPIRREDTKVNIAFVFTGQGAQWAGMSRELLHWSVFRQSVLKSQSCLEELQCSWSLIGTGSLSSFLRIPLIRIRYSFGRWREVTDGRPQIQPTAYYGGGSGCRRSLCRYLCPAHSGAWPFFRRDCRGVRLTLSICIAG